MKKFTVIILALALAVSMCACATTADTPTDTPTARTETEVLSPSADEGAAGDASALSAQELDALLADFGEKIQAGSAGSSLKAAVQAARLLDWAAATELSDEEIIATAENYLAALDDAARAEYLLQIAALDAMCTQLMQSGQEGLLESAGVTDCGYPWGDEVIRVVDAVMTGLGQLRTDDTGATAAYDA